MLILYRLRDTSQKLQASRLKDWMKNFLHLNYLPKKSRNLCRVGTFLLSGFPKCLPSFDAAKLIVIPGEMEQKQSSNTTCSARHLIVFTAFIQPCNSISHCDSNIILPIYQRWKIHITLWFGGNFFLWKTNHFHLIKFCGFFPDIASGGLQEECTKV